MWVSSLLGMISGLYLELFIWFTITSSSKLLWLISVLCGHSGPVHSSLLETKVVVFSERVSPAELCVCISAPWRVSKAFSACGPQHRGQQHAKTDCYHHVKYLAAIMLLIFYTLLTCSTQWWRVCPACSPGLQSYLQSFGSSCLGLSY